MVLTKKSNKEAESFIKDVLMVVRYRIISNKKVNMMFRLKKRLESGRLFLNTVIAVRKHKVIYRYDILNLL